MRTLLSDGRPLLSAGAPLATREWSDLAAWTHSWDAADATLYTPSAQEQTDYGISATPRVAQIADRHGGYPMLRDTGPYSAFNPTLVPMPGPQWIPSSARFNGRPAVHFDNLPNVATFSVLSPCVDFTDPNTFFNPPNGYPATWTIAGLARIATGRDSIFDSQQGGPGAMSTIGNAGQVVQTGGWSVSNWSNDDPDATLTLAHDGATGSTETVLFIVRTDATPASSRFFLQWRETSGRLNSELVIGTLDDHGAKEFFGGWVHEHYMSAYALIDRALTTDEITAILGWSAVWTPTAAALAAEP